MYLQVSDGSVSSSVEHLGSTYEPVDLTRTTEVTPTKEITPPTKEITTEELHEIVREDIMEFATTTFVSLPDIKEEARNFNLVVIQSSRRGGCDRVTFGLRSKVRKVLSLSKVII